MKRTKLMVGVLALSAALLGTGYAAWTDTLNLTTNASTGKLCVIYGKDATLDEELSQKGEATASEKVERQKGKNNEDNHGLTFTLQNLAPGNVIVYETSFQNVGTLTAILQEMKVGTITQVGDKEVTDGFKEAVKVQLLVEDQIVASGDLNGIVLTKPDVMLSPASEETEEDEADVKIVFAVQEEGMHTEAQGVGANIEVEFNWQQRPEIMPFN